MVKRYEYRYVPLADVTESPGGFVDHVKDHWWAYVPDKGLLFYGDSPQCNTDRRIMEMAHFEGYPEHELIFVPNVYLPIDMSDYV